MIDAVLVDDEIDDDIDIRLSLWFLEKDSERKKILEEQYTDIFLIFDMEPHYQKEHFSVIKRMLEVFNSSDENGKLFINYPMMQSYRHINKMPDLAFRDKMVTAEEVRHYKEVVGQQSCYQNLKTYNYEILLSICAHHLMKINYILYGEYEIPSKERFLQYDYVELFNYELTIWQEHNKIDVLNTFVLWMLEYRPGLYLKKLKQNKDMFTY